MDQTVSLRPLEDDDLDAVFEQMRDPESVRMAAFTSADPDDRVAFDARMERLRSSAEVLFRVIEAGGDVVGTIGAFGAPGETELTYWIDRRYWGQGVASAALAALLGELTVRPLHARTASDNVGSIRVLEKHGFRAVGTDRGFAAGRDEGVDETIFILE